MARRVSRRSEDELLIHKAWFRALSAAGATILSTLSLAFAHSSHSQTGYIFAVAALALSFIWAIRSIRYVFDR